jgi:uncharacterized membrane protein YesL
LKMVSQKYLRRYVLPFIVIVAFACLSSQFPILYFFFLQDGWL